MSGILSGFIFFENYIFAGSLGVISRLLVLLRFMRDSSNGKDFFEVTYE